MPAPVAQRRGTAKQMSDASDAHDGALVSGEPIFDFFSIFRSISPSSKVVIHGDMPGLLGGQVLAALRLANHACICASATAYSPRADFHTSAGRRSRSDSSARCAATVVQACQLSPRRTAGQRHRRVGSSGLAQDAPEHGTLCRLEAEVSRTPALASSLSTCAAAASSKASSKGSSP